jgi:hypothetical protein
LHQQHRNKYKHGSSLYTQTETVEIIKTALVQLAQFQAVKLLLLTVLAWQHDPGLGHAHVHSAFCNDEKSAVSILIAFS